VTEIADVEGNDFLVQSCFHGKEDFMCDSAMDIDGIIGIADEEGGTKFFFLHLELLNEFPMNETCVCSTINESMLGKAMLSLA